jgi:hypothetical protein
MNIVKGYIHSYDHDFFSDLTPQSAYLAGFIASDGHLGAGKQVKISLKHNDISHLTKFETITHTTNKAKQYKNNCNITWSNCYKWFDDLYRIYNITECKSLTLKPPNISDYILKLYFIAGYIDGDGSWSFTIRKENHSLRERITIYGTKEIIQWIHDTLKIPGSVHKHKMIYTVFYSGVFCTKVRDIILKNVDNNLLMKRKWFIEYYRRNDNKTVQELLNEGYRLCNEY